MKKLTGGPQAGSRSGAFASLTNPANFRPTNTNYYNYSPINPPPPQDNAITHQGTISEYCYAIEDEEELLFNASYSVAVTRDPFNGAWERYLCFEMKSKLDGHGLVKFGGRPPMNFAIVLDTSGSMMDGFSRTDSKYKIDVARESLITLVERMKPDDKLGIVLFNTSATVLLPLTYVHKIHKEQLYSKIRGINAGGGTDLACGMEAATNMHVQNIKQEDASSKADSRIMFLTDMCPTAGDISMLRTFTQKNADRKIYTSFIGIGIDFGVDLAFELTTIKGCSYYSVESCQAFRAQMVDDFDYNVMAICHDVRLLMDTKDFEVENMYGAPKTPNQEKGEALRIETISPSPKTKDGVKGGVVLLKLKPTGDRNSGGKINLRLKYEDWDGKAFDRTDTIEFPPIPETGRDYFQNNVVRKGILLVRFVNIMKAYFNDVTKRTTVPTVCLNTGITEKLGASEITIREPIENYYKPLFAAFMAYFSREADVMEDKSMTKDFNIVANLCRGVEPPAGWSLEQWVQKVSLPEKSEKLEIVEKVKEEVKVEKVKEELKVEERREEPKEKAKEEQKVDAAVDSKVGEASPVFLDFTQ